MQTKKIDREQIQLSIQDWKERLNKLYKNIEEWSGAFGIQKEDIKKINIPQVREELMSQFDVEPEKVPAIAILQKPHRVSFVPLGLWVIGCNGRINITEGKHSYILADMGGEEGSPSDWVIADSRTRNKRVSFDQAVLGKLIEGKAIFA